MEAQDSPTRHLIDRTSESPLCLPGPKLTTELTRSVLDRLGSGAAGERLSLKFFPETRETPETGDSVSPEDPAVSLLQSLGCHRQIPSSRVFGSGSSGSVCRQQMKNEDCGRTDFPACAFAKQGLDQLGSFLSTISRTKKTCPRVVLSMS